MGYVELATMSTRRRISDDDKVDLNKEGKQQPLCEKGV